MYFPYLRGRQFDLIAIRELLENDLIDENIIPIIEPIKLTSTLISTLSLFVEKERDILIIQNPSVGNFANELEGHDLYDGYVDLLKSKFVIISHILNENSSRQIQEITLNIGKDIKDLAIIHRDISLLPMYKQIYLGDKPEYNIIPDEQSFRRKLRNQNLICIKDKFVKQKRNTDYVLKQDEFFSEEHLHYSSENLKGFSDYSVVGDDYSEGGFAPYAIALHIVYFSQDDNDDNILRIRHFVSDSNEDIRDPALKCAQALGKLDSWLATIEKNKVETYAINRLLEYYSKGSYPGLPSLKKLAIMHHIQLVNVFLRGVI